MKILAQNKKAFYDYDILDQLEAGIVLSGDEVKSVKAGRASLIGAFATIHKGELFLTNCHIPAYEQAYTKQDDTRQPRKLLVHKKELHRLVGDISRKGVTVVPLKMYSTKKGMIKVELGLAKHKKAPSKKAALKERDLLRETERELKRGN
ncbi:SsrA-binding protein SmpB [Candidatus Babeliales bacterium]|nr:SsrA-binding protein SmpB [Candidatus Babeliales bacterium]